MPGSVEGGVIAPISLQKEGAAIPFPEVSQKVHQKTLFVI
jgi:hypothetical protein